MTRVMYVVECPFCHMLHREEHWDALEAHIARCRERASRRTLGLLEDYAPTRCTDAAVIATGITSRVTGGNEPEVPDQKGGTWT